MFLAVSRPSAQPVGGREEEEGWVGAAATPRAIHTLGPVHRGRHCGRRA
jgi:hypothetical protein